MMKYTSIFKVAVAVMVICTLIFTSCDKQTPDSVLAVSVKNQTVESPAGQIFVSVVSDGAWTIGLADENGGTDVSWASLNVDSGTGNKNNVILTYEANDGEDQRVLEIIVDNGASWSKCSFTQLGRDQLSVPVPVPDMDLTKTGWLELPSMENEDLGYYSHSFEMKGRNYRNYSFGWSQKDLVALWVAYPLCSMYTNKTVSRTNEWNYDPLLGQEYSSAPFGGYGGWYARGHQCPSADRLCSYEANAQTFYGTNIAPQLNQHNEGIWSALEGKVRNLANTSDTTYVVTGCVVKGSEETTYDSDDKPMTVPVAYYKALLRYSKASTLSTWAAAAFYTEHKDYGDYTPFKDLAMSVDELEEILGLDLFVNLPAHIGESRAAELEAEDPVNNPVWGL